MAEPHGWGFSVSRSEDFQLSAITWAALGGVPGELTLWDLPDGSLTGQEKEVTGRLVEVVGDGRATLLLAPYLEDGHPDHDALGRAAQRAAYRTGAVLFHYPLWLWPRSPPPWTSTITAPA